MHIDLGLGNMAIEGQEKDLRTQTGKSIHEIIGGYTSGYNTRGIARATRADDDGNLIDETSEANTNLETIVDLGIPVSAWRYVSTLHP